MWSPDGVNKVVDSRSLAATRDANGIRPPLFCTTGTAVSLEVAAVDLTGLRDPAILGGRRQGCGSRCPGGSTGSNDYRPSSRGRIRMGSPPNGHRT